MSRVFSIERYIASRISRRLFTTSRVTSCDDRKIPKKEASVIDKPAEDTDLLKTDDEKLLDTYKKNCDGITTSEKTIDWNSYLKKAKIPDDRVDEYASMLNKNEVRVQDFAWLTKEHLMKIGITCFIHAGRIINEAKNTKTSSVEIEVQVKKPEFTFPSRENNSFQAILKRNFFVDKTAVVGKIMDLLHGSPVFITAPRRFGKTTVLDLFECFFGGTLSEDTFRSLKIGEDEKAFEWYNRYTVVYVTFESANDIVKTRDDCVESCRLILHSTFKRYENMVSHLPPTQVTAFNEWLDEKKYQDKNEIEVLYGLRFLLECISDLSEKRILLLIDDFDKICLNGIYEAGSNLSEIIEFYCNMVANVVKHAPVCTSIFTGITDISSKGFSNLNNLMGFQFLDNCAFYEFYGVLESEFNELMTRETISEKVKNQADTARKWYNGYDYEGTNIYNIFSVTNFIENEEVRSYWQQSGQAEGLLQSLHNDWLRDNIRSLLNGESVSITLLDFSPKNFSHVKDGRYVEVNCDCILIFLKQQGYLTAVANTNNYNPYRNVQVRIPNREVRREFSETMYTFYKKRYNFNPEKIEQCYNWFQNMDMSNARECEKCMRNVKTTLIDLLRDTCDTDIKESWYEAFLYSIFLQDADVRTQKKVEGTPMYLDRRHEKILDLLVRMKDRNFIIELSLTETGEEALKKSIEKQYYKDVENTGLDYMLIGIGIHKKKKKLVDVSICFMINKTEGKGQKV